VFGIFGTSFEELALDHPDAAVRAESRRRFDALVAFARELGAPGVTILPGVAFDDDALDRAAAELPERVAAAGDAGLELRVEPHVGSIAETPAQALCLVELVPGLRLTYDESHFAYQGYGQDETAALLPHAGHVHLRQAAPGVMQARTREGSIDFRRHVADLDAAGYRGFLGLEYQWDEWLECTRVDCLSETAELRDLLLS
jgi:sugar phosphate isomerase/epimerase